MLKKFFYDVWRRFRSPRQSLLGSMKWEVVPLSFRVNWYQRGSVTLRKVE